MPSTVNGTAVNDRRRSPDAADVAHPSKRLKTGHDLPGAADGAFVNKLFDPAYVAQLHSAYLASRPYLHSVIDELVNPDLLQSVQNEIIGELTFTEKETDIYKAEIKVHQTGDLASLSYISSEELSRLPALLRLRNALYSAPFRQLMRDVTGCGPLSSSKQDLSVNSYKKGCHLLNHDDVIGTRRVSYILYMPIGPNGSRQWDPRWGGALELYPVHQTLTEKGETIMEPDVKPSVIIPPSWNQFAFFEVQPGHSFHSVEEVVVGTGQDGVQRLSISGWFHAAQEGEEGYDPQTSSEEYITQNSSLSQLASSSDDLTPITPSEATTQTEFLTTDQLAELKAFLNPAYLQPQTLKALSEKFVTESSIELHMFLREDIASTLAPLLREADTADGLGEQRGDEGKRIVPSHEAATKSGEWIVKGPPHKQRYAVLSPSLTPPPNPSTPAESTSATALLHTLQTRLFPSPAFHAWLRQITTLVPLAYGAEARRFRPGLDYTLARSKEEEVRLDVVFGLTPDAQTGSGSGKGDEGWEDGNWGGWECYMAPHDGDDDPAVYRSGSHKKSTPTPAQSVDKDGDTDISASLADKNGENEDEAQDDDDEDDDTLLTVQAGYNRLLLVLRDEGVMRFVKYVSAAAPGSRWDVAAEYSVGQVQEDGDEE